MNTTRKLSKAMKLFVLLFVVHLSLSALVPKADKLDAQRAQKIPLEAQKLTGAPLAEYLKKNQKLFQVDPTPAIDRYKRMVMDLKYSKEKPKAKLSVVKDENDDGGDIPESFDSRFQWGWMCPSLWYIRDQSLCGSCWALSSAAAMSDRLCIATNGAVQVELSGDDILSCCKDCGKGCDGGWPLYAFDYFSFTGTVTGGNYGTQDCCRPYEIPPCGYHAGEPYYDCNAMYKGTPACVKECQPGYYNTYPMDKYYGIASYSLPNSVTEIQRDIMKYGSVVGTFTVYEDFYNYKSGIYKHTAGNEIGSHAVKIVGWGQEGDTPYWIIANSWHNDWGENGFFRMIRGINDCGIEENVVAVLVGNGKK